ncbi:MAG: energy transducer TonB [Sphingomonadaceae bacterium]
MKAGVALILFLLLGTAAAAAPAEPDQAWYKQVSRLIAHSQNYPRSAQIRGEEGTTRLKISLAADGTITTVELAASSGSAILDRQARATLNEIGKLPSPPGGPRTLSVPIVWRLN